MTDKLLPCPFCCKRLERNEAFSTRSQDHYTHPALEEHEKPCVIETISIVVTDREHDIERVNGWNRRDFSPATIVTGIIAEMATALPAQPRQVPKGYALVPVKPTKAMVRAAINIQGVWPDEAKAAWKAMVKAATSEGINHG